jgi:colicin import membrane protein
MNKSLVLMLLVVSFSAQSQQSNDAERLRISNERAALEARFNLENTACYKKYLVNRCLDDVKLKHGEALADLRRQEISMADQERKAKGAAQVKKTEDKDSPERQQQAADKRAESLKDFEARAARDEQKKATRSATEANEKSKQGEAASRAKSAQDKLSSRAAKQAATSEELKKYNQRLEKAKQRQARLARDKASQTRPPAQSLPVVN